MASLNHVCIWSKEDNWWKPITVEQASMMYPMGTVSVHSGLFMCACCRQYVTLTYGSKQARAFKHSRGESDKSCPERSMGADYRFSLTAGEHTLPIRIVSVSSLGYSLEIGLIYVPNDVIDKYYNDKILIRPDNTEKPFVYLFERLKSNSITYLPIGSNPAAKYEINTTGELAKYWPSVVEGIQYKGRLFDGLSGKMLTVDADVTINHTYYLLCVTNPYYKYPDVEIKKICENHTSKLPWKVFEIRAINYSEDAAKFFLEYRCLLTDKPINMQVMWPVHIKKTYSIIQVEDYSIWHITGGGDVSVQVYPSGKGDCKILDKGSYGKTVCVECADNYKIVSVGRHTPIDYAYIWREKSDYEYSYNSILVEDMDGNTIGEWIQNRLPRKQILMVVSDFDGYVIIERNETIIDEYSIRAGKRMEISDIDYGKTIKIYQGLDLCREISFKRSTEKRGEDIILKKLETLSGSTMVVPERMIAHSWFQKYPQVRNWLSQKIRNGSISCNAYKYLRKSMIGGER